MMLHNLITHNSLKINIHNWFLPGYGVYNTLTLIIKLTDRGASRSYFKNFCPRPRPRLCHLVYLLELFDLRAMEMCHTFNK